MRAGPGHLRRQTVEAVRVLRDGFADEWHAVDAGNGHNVRLATVLRLPDPSLGLLEIHLPSALVGEYEVRSVDPCAREFVIAVALLRRFGPRLVLNREQIDLRLPSAKAHLPSLKTIASGRD
jgi:hypothetical protein